MVQTCTPSTKEFETLWVTWCLQKSNKDRRIPKGQCRVLIFSLSCPRDWTQELQMDTMNCPKSLMEVIVLHRLAFRNSKARKWVSVDHPSGKEQRLHEARRLEVEEKIKKEINRRNTNKNFKMNSQAQYERGLNCFPIGYL